MMDLSKPYLSVYHGDKLLFDLRWQSPERFQVVDSNNGPFAGSYLVPAAWYERYMAYCEEMRKKEPNQSPVPTAPSGRGSP
jgi:hypothetical protein